MADDPRVEAGLEMVKREYSRRFGLDFTDDGLEKTLLANRPIIESILAAADAAAWRPMSEANYKDSQIVAFREGPRGMIDTGEGIHWKDDKWIVDGRAVKPIYFLLIPNPPQE